MSVLKSKGNLAVLEYDRPENEPEFNLDAKGVLFIFGYNMAFAGRTISVAKRFDTGLKNYSVIGKYDYAKERIIGDFDDLLDGLNRDNCVIMVSINSIDKP